MSPISSNLNRAIDDSVRVLQSLKNLEPQVTRAADLIWECLRTGNKLLICGNGGSASDASHFATELVVRFTKDRRALPAICLVSDTGILTAAGNDYGFDEIFARQVAAFGLPSDVLICLTTSGKSKNVVQKFRRNRSEEHTSELQSRRDLVCRLLLEKKKTQHSPNRLPNALEIPLHLSPVSYRATTVQRTSVSRR